MTVYKVIHKRMFCSFFDSVTHNDKIVKGK